jgi:hypothetical protein
MPFDPNQHLLSQGWQGKGTGESSLEVCSSREFGSVSHRRLVDLLPALKDGHATRPIAVVQKKTLAGVGKDRDESTPFWDQ